MSSAQLSTNLQIVTVNRFVICYLLYLKIKEYRLDFQVVEHIHPNYNHRTTTYNIS